MSDIPDRITTAHLQGREGDITGIVDTFSTRDHLVHCHLANSPHMTVFADWALEEVCATGTPIIRFPLNSSLYGLLPQDRFPPVTTPYYLDTQDPKTKALLVRGDQLPSRWMPFEAETGGIPGGDFLVPYQRLQHDLSGAFKKTNRCHYLTALIKDPSIFKAAELTLRLTKRKDFLSELVQRGLRRHGVWNESYGHAQWSRDIIFFPRYFNFDATPNLIRTIGGWPDYTIDRYNTAAPYSHCNFSITKVNNNRIYAVVQSVSIDYAHGSHAQRRFAEALVAAFL